MPNRKLEHILIEIHQVVEFMSEVANTESIMPYYQTKIRDWAKRLDCIYDTIGSMPEFNGHNEQTQTVYDQALIENKKLKDDVASITIERNLAQSYNADLTSGLKNQIDALSREECLLRGERELSGALIKHIREARL